jgi:hypothetical protein
MKKAYLELIKNALAKDLTVSVHDGGEWQVKRSSGYQEIKDAIESVDFSELRLRNKAGEVVGWAQIVLDCEPDCTVSDMTYNELMHELTGSRWDGE